MTNIVVTVQFHITKVAGGSQGKYNNKFYFKNVKLVEEATFVVMLD